MSVEDKLNEIKYVKDQLKQILINKGMMTAAEQKDFSQYASIIEKMQK